jgi:hypothetical protein
VSNEYLLNILIRSFRFRPNVVKNCFRFIFDIIVSFCKMPFVTVVTLGSSGASDFLSNVVKPQSEGKSQLTGIREIGENELFEDYPFTHGDSKNVNENEDVLNLRKKSVSSVDLRLGQIPYNAESGYEGSGGSNSGSSSISSTSSSSCSSGSSCASTICSNNGSFSVLRNEDDLLFIANGDVKNAFSSTHGGTISKSSSQTQIQLVGGSIYGDKFFNGGSGGTVQGKANIWKTWIRNKLNLSKNGKYSFEGSSACLGHFGIKAVMIMTIIIAKFIIFLNEFSSFTLSYMLLLFW